MPISDRDNRVERPNVYRLRCHKIYTCARKGNPARFEYISGSSDLYAVSMYSAVIVSGRDAVLKHALDAIPGNVTLPPPPPSSLSNVSLAPIKRFACCGSCAHSAKTSTLWECIYESTGIGVPGAKQHTETLTLRNTHLPPGCGLRACPKIDLLLPLSVTRR